LVGGRWNPVGFPVIYAAESYALALLETLLHAQIGVPPPACRYVEIEIPDEISSETVRPEDLPGWDHPDFAVAQAYGRDWIRDRRSAILRVPSVVSPTDRNIVINPAHPSAGRVTPGPERPLAWETRLASLVAGRRG
jgi:RES domain-containing protein